MDVWKARMGGEDGGCGEGETERDGRKGERGRENEKWKK